MPKNKPINLVESDLVNRHVLIEVTKGCNLNCRHCFTAAGNKMKNELDIAEWKLAIKDLNDSGFNAFTLSGGEPLLEKEKVFGLAKEIKRLNNRAKVYLFTNCKLVNREVARRIKKIFDGVMVSLDGDKKTHNWLRRNKKSYDDVIAALTIFQEIGVPVSLQSMITDKNINYFKKLVKIAEKYSVIAIRFSQVDLFGRAREFKNDLKPNNELLAKLDRKIKKMSENSKVFLTSNLISRKKLMDRPEKYRQPSLHILANGSILPWYGFTKKYELLKYPKERFGKMTLKEITNKLKLFNKLLDKAEKNAKILKNDILAYDNIIAGYLFNK